MKEQKREKSTPFVFFLENNKMEKPLARLVSKEKSAPQ